jgi:hypothetical protein
LQDSLATLLSSGSACRRNMILMLRLKVDNNFAPYPVATGDELFPNGVFEFNITKMLECIRKHPNKVTLEEVAVSDFYKGFSSINKVYMDSVV